MNANKEAKTQKRYMDETVEALKRVKEGKFEIHITLNYTKHPYKWNNDFYLSDDEGAKLATSLLRKELERNVGAVREWIEKAKEEMAIDLEQFQEIEKILDAED